MNWLNLALASTLAMGLVNILDSHLLSRRLPGVRAFLLPLGGLFLLFGGVLAFLFPLPEVPAATLAAALGSGLLRTSAILLMFYLLRREDVSQVVPITYSFPILVAIAAGPLFGESLNYWHWLAVIVVVGGAVLMSPGLGQKAAGWRKSLLPLIGAIVLLTGVDLTSKSALSAVSPWSLFWVNLLILSIVFLAVSLRRPTLDQLRHLPQKKLTAALLLGDFALSMTGFLFFLQAMENGPVSIVSTISGSRPIFVLIFSLLVARFWPGFLQRRTGRGGLRLRIVATVMIVGGIAAMYLLR